MSYTYAEKPVALDETLQSVDGKLQRVAAALEGGGIATTTVAGRVKPDGDTILVDVNGKISTGKRRTRRNITTDLTNLPQAISEQNFEKYGYSIGDYFVGASGYDFILGDLNPFKGTSTPYCIATNHCGIVVDTHATHEWHSGDVSSVGYAGSTLHTYLSGTVLDNIKSDLTALFGSWNTHLLSHSKLFTTALANWGWSADQYISALTCTQIDAGSQWTANGFQEGIASKSLEVFRKYKWTEIFGSEYPWLRNISNYNGGLYACIAHHNGFLDGDSSVTLANYVVGLINFY